MRRLTTLVLLFTLTVSACVDSGEPVDDGPLTGDADVDIDMPATPRPLASPETVDADCPEDLADDAECGFLVVPEDRSNPSGPVIEMAWARLPGDRAGPGGSLLVLPDGPGQGALDDEAWVDSPLRADRDIILIDPRGTGRSFPSLDCGQPPRPGALPLDLVEDCQRALVAEAVDLSAYDTTAIAADVADLARTLELSPVNVLGIGHGAKVALTLLRTEPDVLRALVLDSPVPPEVDVYAERPGNGQAALNRLLDECAQHPGCRDAYGDLQQSVDRLIARLDTDPADAGAGMEVSGSDLVLAALAAMRGTAGPGIVPSALAAAVAGEPAEALTRLQDAAISGAAVPTSSFSEGLRLSVDCREEVPYSRVGDDGGAEDMGPVGRAVAGDVAELLSACAFWGADEASADVNDPVTGDVPTLVLVGEFDPLSPPAWGAATAARLDIASVVQVGGAGHRVHDTDDCTLGLLAGFLTAPSRQVDGTCAADRTVAFDLS